MGKRIKTKRDLITALRVYKNRLDIYGDLMYDDLMEFDDKFRFVMSSYHCGEIYALKDLFRTYLAYAYGMGITVGKSGRLGYLKSSIGQTTGRKRAEIEEERNGLQNKNNRRKQVSKDERGEL